MRRGLLGKCLLCVGLGLLPACAGIGVRQTKQVSPFADLPSNLLANQQPSPRTIQTLRLYDLEASWAAQPDEVLKRLHAEAVKEPRQDLLFALAELNYLRGEATAKKVPAQSIRHFTHCCAYAQHFLLSSCPASARHPAEIQQTAVKPPSDLTPRDAFDPRFRIACNLYNAGLARCLRTAQNSGRLDTRKFLRRTGPDGAEEQIPVVHTGFAWQDDDFGLLYFSDDYRVVGLANHYRDYGLGVPLIGSLADAASGPNSLYPNRLRFPITALIQFEGGLNDLDRPGSTRIELYNPRVIQAATLAGRKVPLEADLTTPLAHQLQELPAERLALEGFFRSDKVRGRGGLKFLEPYQPGKIPVVMVHGLLSTPATWAPFFNDIQADPQIRDRFQFWVFSYPTSDPYLRSAAELRRLLRQRRGELDPQRADRSWDQMVLVGHSMGGLISRLQTVEGGDDFWQLVSKTPFEKLKARPDVRLDLENTFYFEPLPEVRRVVFLGTPHQGSRLSPSWPARAALRFVRVPHQVLEASADLARENPGQTLHALPTSIDLLAPDSGALRVLASRPKPQGVHYHSVIGVAPRSSARVERWLSGDGGIESDGVVPYTSAHLEEAETELVVTADHYTVHQHPLAVREVRRILFEHLRTAGPAPADGARAASGP